MWWRVLIFDSIGAMRRHVKIQEYDRGHGLGRRWLGLCRTYRIESYVGGRWVSKPDNGTIFLCKPHCTAAVVSHEATHAGVAYLERRGKSIQYGERRGTGRLASNTEELLCEVVGNLTGSIWRGYHRFCGS